jgi:large subunit ribosomal protein L17
VRHQKARGKLGRPSGHRLALVRNQVTSLLAHERITTTDAKAKVLRRVADRMITLGKRGTLHARRRALAVIRDRAVAAKVFGELAERFASRPGGYTRVLKLRRRAGDAAPLSIIELVERRAEGAAPAQPARRGEKAGKAAKGGAAPKAQAKARKPAAAEKPAKGRARKPRAGRAGPGEKRTRTTRKTT